MIRWILGLRWLSITLISASSFLVLAGIELTQSNLLGLIPSALISGSVFLSRKFGYWAIVVYVIAAASSLYFSTMGLYSALFLAQIAFFATLFGNKIQRRLVHTANFVVALGFSYYLGIWKDWFISNLGSSPATDLQRSNSFLLVLAIVGLGLMSASLLGRQAFIQIEHIGSPADKAAASVQSSRLRLEVAKQNERLEIAKDLSELLVERISAVVSIAEGGRYSLVADPTSGDRALGRALDSARAAQSELRRLYDFLNGSLISQTTRFKIADLQELAVSYRELGFNTVVHEQGQSFELNEGIELCVYKIVFEALENVRKHSQQGTEVTVDFLWSENGLQVLVKDNGIEFANRAKASLGEVVEGYSANDDIDSLLSEIDGATLAALRDRAAIYKGKIEANAVPGVGFTLSAIFPELKTLSERDR